jgi:putative salt-induced outer membrane protein YdiY
VNRPAIVVPLVLSVVTLTAATFASAQTPPEPPPIWDAQLGASFVGTGGNSDTSTFGADAAAHHRWSVWQVEATAAAVRATDRGTRTAERYLGAFRGERRLTPLLGLSAGERAERDRLAGMDFRSITDVGLQWALVRQKAWTLDGLTSLAMNHERPVVGRGRNDTISVLQARSKFAFGATGDTTERFTVYPDFKETSAYRAEAEATAQAAMTTRLALKIGYLWRYSNAPTLGFVKSDRTATASVVVRWKGPPVAPVP